MVKFSSEFREKVVLEYLTGGRGTKFLAKKYGIGSHQTVLDWVNRYEKYGVKAFNVLSQNGVYDGNFKLDVLEWMNTNRASLHETALHFNISTVVQFGIGRGNSKKEPDDTDKSKRK